MPPTHPFNTACKNCRLAKAKCIRVDGGKSNGEKCRRCRAAGWECSLIPRARRKRRKGMEKRVEVLEGLVREVEGLMGRAKTSCEGTGREESAMEKVRTESLVARLDGEVEGWALMGMGTGMLPLMPESGSLVTSGKTVAVATVEASSSSCNDDLVEDGWSVYFGEPIALPGIIPDLLTFEEARHLLARFRTNTVHQFPLILLSNHDTIENLARTKPNLLLAIITAASMSGPGELFKRLHDELTKRLAMKVVVGGERSLELVQALLVMEVWYCLPEDGEGDVNFYQWIHIAATMALQLGLGKNQWEEVGSVSEMERAMEEARILLAVYLSCSSAAVSLRRENMMKITPYLQACLLQFEKHAVHINDNRLLAWVRLQMIAEEAQSITPQQEHVRGWFLSKSTDVASQIYCLQRELELWEKSLEPATMNETLLIHHLYCKTKILEIPMNQYHDLSRLIAYPFLCDSGAIPMPERDAPPILAPVYMRTALPFIDACHKLLDNFAPIPPEALGNCPTVVFVRAIYAMGALRLVAGGWVFEEDMEAQRRIEDVQGRVAAAFFKAAGERRRQIPGAVLRVWRRFGENKRTKENADLPMTLNAASWESRDNDERLGQPNTVPGPLHDYIPLIDYSCALTAQSDLENHMETFANGFGIADLVM